MTLANDIKYATRSYGYRLEHRPDWSPLHEACAGLAEHYDAVVASAKVNRLGHVADAVDRLRRSDSPEVFLENLWRTKIVRERFADGVNRRGLHRKSVELYVSQVFALAEALPCMQVSHA